jgi:hypothetical protein
MSEEKKSKYYDLGTVFKKPETDFTYMKLNIGKFKGQFTKIVGTTQDGQEVELSADTLVTLQSPKEKFQRIIKDEDQLAEKIQKMEKANIIRVATAVVK